MLIIYQEMMVGIFRKYLMMLRAYRNSLKIHRQKLCHFKTMLKLH